MTVTIRKALIADLPAVHALIVELAVYERAADQVVNTIEDMIADGFGAKPLYQCFVAEHENAIVGISLVYPRYSTWKGKCLYLEDIVVREALRGKGIGSKLFEFTMEYALHEGYNLLTWQVLDWNQPAIEFYKRYGSSLDPEWVNGKLTKSEMKQWLMLKRK
jgi:GNAT superfamily N-acetyltransferase